MAYRMLVAGVGNIFLGDDGFGVEVAQRLLSRPLPAWVKVVDYGIRGIHMAYDMMDTPYETVVLVDAASRGEAPGTVFLLEPTPESLLQGDWSSHSVSPQAAFGTLAQLGGTPGQVLVVGCEPASVADEMGLSAPVEAAVEAAIAMILELIERQSGERPCVSPSPDKSSKSAPLETISPPRM